MIRLLNGLFLAAFAIALFLATPWFAPHAFDAIKYISNKTGLQIPTPKPLPAPQPPPQAPPPPPPPKPLPTVFVPSKPVDTSEMFNGIHVQLNTDLKDGLSASYERTTPSSYTLNLDFRVNVPKAARSPEALASANPNLPQLIPSLGHLLKSAEVSQFYHGLYERKSDQLRHQTVRLDKILSRHNFYDCETILEIKASPRTKDPAAAPQPVSKERKLLWIQADMDVVTDGSDPDRTLEVDTTSAHFQPTTSYRWPRAGGSANPLADLRREKLKKASEEQATQNLSPRRKQELQSISEQLKREILELDRYRFLVAKLDPFIVLPSFMFRYQGHHPFAPSIGDFAIVIAGDKIMPAIVGDAGPSYKTGEASLRIAQAIQPDCNGQRRPVSDLSVSYLVFPGTAEKKQAAPDFAAWHAQCALLWEEIGCDPLLLHKWEETWKTPPPITQPAQEQIINASPAPAIPPAAQQTQ